MCRDTLNINQLVGAANKNDRFKLLNDDSVPESNLDNAIHPIFHDASFLEHSDHLRQALQLASLFLEYDSVLEFFIPLTYGRQQTDSSTGRAYPTNPASYKSDAEIKSYIKGVRGALHCLTHCLVFRWVDEPGTERLWGRTTLFDRRPAHTSSCSDAFVYRKSILIELNHNLRKFYEDEKTGYASRTRCDQFRHDFQLASTLIHEIVHAYGAMRRGGLLEPFLRLDYPRDSAEWGYAWENFMFGCIVNPQDREKFGTHVQFRKTWADAEVAKQNGGKEYSAVPVRWTAQWFRKETWAKIEKGGPLAIPFSVTQLKFVLSSKYSRWLILTDVPETEKDLHELQHTNITARRLKDPTIRLEDLQVRKLHCQTVGSDYLQKSNVPVPCRVPAKFKGYNVSGSSVKAAPKKLICKTTLTTPTRAALQELPPLSPPAANTRSKRTRGEEGYGSGGPSKVIRMSTA
jgi:hypothetical protein